MPRAKTKTKTRKPRSNSKAAMDVIASSEVGRGSTELEDIISRLGCAEADGHRRALAEVLAGEILMRRAMVAERVNQISNASWIRVFGETSQRIIELSAELGVQDPDEPPPDAPRPGRKSGSLLQ